MESALDDLLTILICSVKRSRRVQVELLSNYRAERLSKPGILAPNIGGKLAREIKAADMSSLQAVIYRVRSFRNVRRKASDIGGKLAREVKLLTIR